MRISFRRRIAALALSVLLLARLDAAAQAMVHVPDIFTYQAPVGWAMVDLPGSSYPTAIETASPSQAKAMITVNADLAPGDLGNWCVQAMARNKAAFATLGAQVGAVEPFTTEVGATGYRAPVSLTARGRALYYVLYFFDGGSGTKITLTCACPAADSAHYGPLFEAAMKTFLPR